jgi:hypothetical protein
VQLNRDIRENRESLAHDLLQVSEHFTRDSLYPSDTISELVRETRGLREARERSNVLLKRQAINLEKQIELEYEPQSQTSDHKFK